MDTTKMEMKMKDANDKMTNELIPMPPKRGRPATGKALSNAERQAKFREEHGSFTKAKARATAIEMIESYMKDAEAATSWDGAARAEGWAFGAAGLARMLELITCEERTAYMERGNTILASK